MTACATATGRTARSNSSPPAFSDPRPRNACNAASAAAIHSAERPASAITGVSPGDRMLLRKQEHGDEEPTPPSPLQAPRLVHAVAGEFWRFVILVMLGEDRVGGEPARRG